MTGFPALWLNSCDDQEPLQADECTLGKKDPIVYVVDDDLSIRKAVRRLLCSAGWSVKVFGSAADFLAYSRHPRPECLVLDIRMPGMSGVELQEVLSDSAPHLPIIFITAHENPQLLRWATRNEIPFLYKPFDEQALLTAVEKGLERSSRERSRPDLSGFQAVP